MSFTATLFKLINAADTISLNGYEAEFDFRWTRMLAACDSEQLVDFDLSKFDQGTWTFRDQEVEVDSEGFCEAQCTEDGIPHSFGFRVSHPITKGTCHEHAQPNPGPIARTHRERVDTEGNRQGRDRPPHNLRQPPGLPVVLGRGPEQGKLGA